MGCVGLKPGRIVQKEEIVKIFKRADERINKYSAKDVDSAKGIEKSIKEISENYNSFTEESDYIKGIYYLGFLNQLKREKLKARQYYMKALRLSKHIPSIVNLAKIAIEGKKYDEAISGLNRVSGKISEADKNKESAFDINYTLAFAYYLKGNSKKAETILRGMIKVGMKQRNLFTFLGKIYMQNKEREMARFVISRGLELYPENAELYYLAGKNESLDNSGRAESMLKKAYEKDKNYVPAITELIEYYVEGGKCREAKKYVKGKINTDDKFYNFALGRLYFCLNDFDNSRDSYMKVLKGYPGFAPAIFNMGHLYFAGYKKNKDALKYFKMYNRELSHIKKPENEMPNRSEVQHYISIIRADLKHKKEIMERKKRRKRGKRNKK